MYLPFEGVRSESAYDSREKNELRGMRVTVAVSCASCRPCEDKSELSV